MFDGLFLACAFWAACIVAGTATSQEPATGDKNSAISKTSEDKGALAAGKITVEVELTLIPKGHAVKIVIPKKTAKYPFIALKKGSVFRIVTGEGPNKLIMAKEKPRSLERFFGDVLVAKGPAKLEQAKTIKATTLANAEVSVTDGKDASLLVSSKEKPDWNGAKIGIKAIAVPKAVHLDINLSTAGTPATSVLRKPILVRPGEPVFLLGTGENNRNLLLKVTAKADKKTADKFKDMNGRQLMALRLRTTVLPIFSFKDTRVSTTFAFLTNQTRNSRLNEKTMNFIVKAARGAAEPTVTANRRNLPLAELLKIISHQTGLKIQNDGAAILVGDFPEVKNPKNKSALEKRLDACILPRGAFEDTPLSGALKFYQIQAKKLDSKGRDFSIKWVNADKKEMPNITGDFYDLPLSKVIAYTCQLADAQFVFKDNSLVVTLK